MQQATSVGVPERGPPSPTSQRSKSQTASTMNSAAGNVGNPYRPPCQKAGTIERNSVPISAACAPPIRRKRRYKGSVMTTAPIRLIVFSAGRRRRQGATGPGEQDGDQPDVRGA